MKIPILRANNTIFSAGFTLPEMILTVAMLALIGGSGIALHRSFQTKNDVALAAVTTVQAMRRAQALAAAGHNDSTWGMYIQPSSVTIFQGSSFASRTVASDEIHPIGPTVVPSGLLEIVFGKLYGLPTATGTTTLTSDVSGDNAAVFINSVGNISY